MKRVICFSIVVLLLVPAAVAFGQGQGKESGRDAKFVEKAAVSGAFEVEAGRLAAQRGQTEAVRQFGQGMVADHDRANAELMQVARAKGIMPPEQDPNSRHARMIDQLMNVQPADFDKTFVKMMIKEHKKDAKLFRQEANKGKDADLQAFASRTLPALEHHLAMVQGMAGKGA